MNLHQLVDEQGTFLFHKRFKEIPLMANIAIPQLVHAGNLFDDLSDIPLRKMVFEQAMKIEPEIRDELEDFYCCCEVNGMSREICCNVATTEFTHNGTVCGLITSHLLYNGFHPVISSEDYYADDSITERHILTLMEQNENKIAVLNSFSDRYVFPQTIIMDKLYVEEHFTHRV